MVLFDLVLLRPDNPSADSLDVTPAEILSQVGPGSARGEEPSRSAFVCRSRADLLQHLHPMPIPFPAPHLLPLTSCSSWLLQMPTPCSAATTASPCSRGNTTSGAGLAGPDGAYLLLRSRPPLAASRQPPAASYLRMAPPHERHGPMGPWRCCSAKAAHSTRMGGMGGASCSVRVFGVCGGR